MPTYVYEVIDENGEPGERFEVVEKMSDQPMKKHPETGQAVRRVFLPFGIGNKTGGGNAEKNLKDDSKLERLGFTKYVKTDEGKYDKVIGKGPDHIQK